MMTSLAHSWNWLPGYLRSLRSSSLAEQATVWVTFADHYEPCWRSADPETARERVKRWRQLWPQIASRHVDSAGQPPRYTFFYPEEEYSPELLDPLAEMTYLGIADVEVHLHHDHDTEQQFVARMGQFLETLSGRHGLLRRIEGQVRFGFIHGNWALDNSRPDGRWCGINNEISLLRDLGCYADFTLPSAPNPTQTRIVNQIYWATDVPSKPKSHDTGIPLAPGGAILGDLLLIPGPLGLNFRGEGRWLPRLETGELAVYDPPVQGRAKSWLKLAPRIGEHIFVKLYTHGAQESNSALLLNGGLDTCLKDLTAECQKRGYRLHYSTAWEMWNAIEAIRLQTRVQHPLKTCPQVQTSAYN